MGIWSDMLTSSMKIIDNRYTNTLDYAARRALLLARTGEEKMVTQATVVMERPVAVPVVVEPETEREQQAMKAMEIAESLGLPMVAQAISVEVGTGTLRRRVLSLLQEQEIPVYPWSGVSNYLERLRNDARRSSSHNIYVRWTRLEDLVVSGVAALPLHALELIKRLTEPLAMISPMEPQGITLEDAGKFSGEVMTISYAQGTGTTIERMPPKPRRLVHFKVSSIEAIRDPFLAIFGVEGDPIVIDYWDEPGYKPFATQ
jgi:hypothetical protein